MKMFEEINGYSAFLTTERQEGEQDRKRRSLWKEQSGASGVRAGEGRPATENHDAEECSGAEKCQQEGACLGSQHQVWPYLYKPVHGGETEVNPPNVGRGGAGGSRLRESIRDGIAGEPSPVRSGAGSMVVWDKVTLREENSIGRWAPCAPGMATDPPVRFSGRPRRERMSSGPEDPAVRRRRDRRCLSVCQTLDRNHELIQKRDGAPENELPTGGRGAVRFSSRFPDFPPRPGCQAVRLTWGQVHG